MLHVQGMRASCGSSALVVLTLVGCAGGRTIVDERDAVTDAAICAPGSVTFVLRAATGDTTRWCTGVDCKNAWRTIVDPRGVEHALDRPCLPDCFECRTVACPASCVAPTPIPAAGMQRTWTGSYFDGGRCGGGGGQPCTTATCAGTGRYVARMCAHSDLASAPSPICDPASTSSCVEVPFDWPPSEVGATVIGVVGGSPDAAVDTDAGACCPATWILYDCEYPDGRAGFNCHNSALGCASSKECGGGCDFVVTGRCG
jgi:hypothetical protein